MLTPKKNILIVEDTHVISDMLVEMLKEKHPDYLCYTAYSYFEGQDILNHQDIEVALLDINLPDKSGIELLKYIKHFYPHITAIMISNSASETYRNYCKKEGAYQFIDKSNEFETIPGIVDSAFMASAS